MTVKVLNNKKLNNMGASMIELLVIIAIIAVLLGGVIISFTVLNSSNLKLADRTTKNYLEKTRTNTMSVVADEWSFNLVNKNGTYVVTIDKKYENADGDTVTDIMDEKELGSRVSASLIAGSSEIAIGNGESLKIVYEPSTGSVKKVTLNGTEYSPAENMINIKYVSGKKNTMVALYFLSGKVEIN